jgi:hypothetical protein
MNIATRVYFRDKYPSLYNTLSPNFSIIERDHEKYREDIIEDVLNTHEFFRYTILCKYMSNVFGVNGPYKDDEADSEAFKSKFIGLIEPLSEYHYTYDDRLTSFGTNQGIAFDFINRLYIIKELFLHYCNTDDKIMKNELTNYYLLGILIEKYVCSAEYFKSVEEPFLNPNLKGTRNGLEFRYLKNIIEIFLSETNHYCMLHLDLKLKNNFLEQKEIPNILVLNL